MCYILRAVDYLRIEEENKETYEQNNLKIEANADTRPITNLPNL